MPTLAAAQVNNAGITRDTLMMRMKPEQWQDVRRALRALCLLCMLCMLCALCLLRAHPCAGHQIMPKMRALPAGCAGMGASLKRLARGAAGAGAGDSWRRSSARSRPVR